MKHYVGYGAAEGGGDYNTAEIPERLLRQVYLPPFQAAKDEGSATFMSAFNAIEWSAGVGEFVHSRPDPLSKDELAFWNIDMKDVVEPA